jgi:FeS assembly SUF system protein
MGFFSFLTGNKDERPEAPDREHPAPAAERPASAGGQQASPADPGADGPAPSAQSPFTPPEAWDIDTSALTAPPPKTEDHPKIGEVDKDVTAELQPKIVEVIKTVFDPEIPVDIYELGLIYEIEADAERKVLVKMTLTSPACPSAQQIPSEVRYKVKSIPEVTEAWVDIVWEPPWDKDRMSEAAKLSLGMF